MTKLMNVIKFENGNAKVGIEVADTHADFFTFKQAKEQIKDCRVMGVTSLDFISENLVILYDDEYLFTIDEAQDLGLTAFYLRDENGNNRGAHEICGHSILCNYEEDEDGYGMYGELTPKQVVDVHNAFDTLQIARGVVPQQNVAKYLKAKLTPKIVFTDIPDWMK